MSNENKVRLAHELLDEINARQDLTPEQTEVLRSYLPEPPMQKTLQEIIAHVDDAWAGAGGNDWGGNSYDSGVTLEDWLLELHAQLKGVEDESAPALPDGMRIAGHEQYGRVVTSPKPNRDGIYDLLVPKPKFETGADWEYAHECELTFIDAEPAKPARPEFLDAEADYENAPNGTVVGVSDRVPWVKIENGDWICGYGTKSDLAMALDGRRQVLRWGWGE